MWVGRLSQMRRKDKSLMNTPILLDAAKEEGVALVCTWFQQSGDLFEHNGCILGLALTGPSQTTEIDADRHACFFSRFVIFF